MKLDEYIVDATLLANYRKSVDFSLFPKKFAQAFALVDPKSQDDWFKERFICLKDPLYLGGFVEAEKPGDPNLPKEYVPILGMDFQVNPHARLFQQFVQKKPGEGLVFSDLEQLTKKMMILWPRGLFKTSAIIIDIVQTILNYPNIRICFLTGGDNLAKRQLKRIKRVFELPSKRFKWLFPEYCMRSIRNPKVAEFREDGSPNPLAWTDVPAKIGTQHEFTVPARTSDTFAEPTFAISTAKSVKAGSHYDIIYIDDLVNETNYRSIKLLEKVYQDYIDICPLLEPTGYIMMTGTRYSFGDTYERIQELAHEEEKKRGTKIWKFSIRDCWSYGCLNCNHTSVYHDYEINMLQPPCTEPGCCCRGFQSNGAKGVLFPETRTMDGRSIGHTLQFLEEKRMEYGEEFFANQYENQPIATGAQVFTDTLIGGQTIHEYAMLPQYSQSFTFVVGDLAYIGQEERDETVLFICRKFQGQIFIIDADAGNWDSGKVAEKTIDILLKHRPDAMYYERFNGWEAYDRIITAAAAERHITKVPLQWEKMPQTPKAKLIRIGSVKGVLQNKRLWIYAAIPGYQKLVNQLCKWPKLGKHDDYADCAGMTVAAPTGYQLETPPVIPTGLNWLRKFNQMEPGDDSYHDNGCGTGIVC